MNAAGQNVALGYAQGIRDGIPEVKLANEAMAKAGITQTQVTTDSHSPSRKYAQLGAWSAEGYGLGFEKEAANTNDAIERAVQPPSAGSGSGGVAVARSGSNVFNINVNITAAELGSDLQAAANTIAQTIRRELESSMQSVATEVAA